MALYVARMVSFDFPQVFPERDFRMSIDFLAFSTVLSACLLKVRVGSKVTPRILGCVSEGIGFPFMVRDVLYLYSEGSVENTVAAHLSGFILSWLVVVQL